LGRDVVYLPRYFGNKKMNFLDSPFLIDEEGVKRELIPDRAQIFSATITRSNERTMEYVDFNTTEILQGKQYHLVYWSQGWKRVGTSIATSQGVYFNHIPSNALLLLLPENPDGFERIFTLEPKTNKIFWY